VRARSGRGEGPTLGGRCAKGALALLLGAAPRRGLRGRRVDRRRRGGLARPGLGSARGGGREARTAREGGARGRDDSGERVERIGQGGESRGVESCEGGPQGREERGGRRRGGIGSARCGGRVLARLPSRGAARPSSSSGPPRRRQGARRWLASRAPRRRGLGSSGSPPRSGLLHRCAPRLQQACNGHFRRAKVLNTLLGYVEPFEAPRLRRKAAFPREARALVRTTGGRLEPDRSGRAPRGVIPLKSPTMVPGNLPHCKRDHLCAHGTHLEPLTSSTSFQPLPTSSGRGAVDLFHLFPPLGGRGSEQVRCRAG
jgi:hypothetical protein